MKIEHPYSLIGTYENVIITLYDRYGQWVFVTSRTAVRIVIQYHVDHTLSISGKKGKEPKIYMDYDDY